MESEHNTGVDDQLLTVQEIAGLLKVPISWVYGHFANAPQTASPRTDSANTGALGPGKCWPGSQGIAAAGRRFDMAITLKIDTEKAGRAIPEERWLEEVSSKDRYSNAAPARKSGWRAGGKMLFKQTAR